MKTAAETWNNFPLNSQRTVRDSCVAFPAVRWLIDSGFFDFVIWVDGVSKYSVRGFTVAASMNRFLLSGIYNLRSGMRTVVMERR